MARSLLEKIHNYRETLINFLDFDIPSSYWVTFEWQRYFISKVNWKPPNLSEVTPIIINMGLTHLGSEAFNCWIYNQINS